MQSTIHHELIFPGADKSEYLSKNPTQKEIEFWEYLLMVGFGNLNSTEVMYKNLREETTENDWRNLLIDIGEAKFFIHSGKQFSAHRKLENAELKLFSTSADNDESFYYPETLALYYYTLSSLHEKVVASKAIFPLFESGKRLTSIQSFKYAFDYRMAHHRVQNFNFPISHLQESLKILDQHELLLLSSIGHKVAGSISMMAGDYPTAFSQFEIAKTTSIRLNLTHNLNQTYNHIAYTYFLAGNIGQAEKVYDEIFIKDKLDPIIPILKENLALIAVHRNDYVGAINLLKEALDVSLSSDTISHLPGECEYLGMTYEKHFKDYEQAEYYYKMGYDHSLRYATHGISLTGDRKSAVESYVGFMTRKSKSSQRKQNRPDPLSFAEGKSWKAIKDEFQHQLLLFHGRNIRNSKQIASHLDMPASTLYSLQDRLKKKGFDLSQKPGSEQEESHTLDEFFSEHTELSWTQINKIFEKEIMHYLYEKYGYNKHRMAKILEISYPSIISKTRELTQVNKHFLPN